MSPAAWALIGLLKSYKAVLSPLLPPSCRFDPTCSVYASDAVRRFGARRGAVLSAKRILRCRPGAPGGFDPVPFDEPA